MKKVFSLFGTIALDGMEGVNKQLKDFDKQMKQMSKELTKTGKQFQTIGKDMTKLFSAPIIAASGAITTLAIKTGQYADKLLDLNQITGLSTDTLQEMEHISRAAGVDFETLSTAASKFTAKIPDLLKGTSETAIAFKKLGVELTDNGGNLRSMDELFPEMIKILQNYSNITERNSIAQQLFGKSMKDLAPVLGLTNDQFDSIRQEAHDMGLVMSIDALNAANDFRIEIDKLKGQFEVLLRTISSDFMPILKDNVIPFIKTTIVPAIKDFSDKIKDTINWFIGLDDATKGSILGLTGFVAAIGPLIFALGKVLVIAGSLRKSILLLNAAMLSNPIGQLTLLLTGLAAAGVLVYNAYKNMNKAMDEHREKVKEDIENKQNQEKIGLIEELIYNYNKLANMDKEVIGEEEYRSTKLAIDNLEKSIGDFGIEFTGSFNNKLDAAKTKLKEFNTALKGTTETVEDTFEEITIKGDDAETIEEERLQKRIDLLTEQVKAEEDAYKTELEIAEKVYDDLDKMEQDRNTESKENLDKYNKMREEGTQRYLEQLSNEIDVEKDHQDQIKQVRNEAINESFNIFSSFTDNQQIALDNKYKKDKERIENTISDEVEREKALENLDNQYNKKRNELRRKQAIIDKAQALFSIGINTAKAISEVLWNPVLVAVVAAMGAAQAAAVALKPIPLQKGALVKGSSSGMLSLLGEQNRDELVLPLEEGVSKLANMLIEKLGSLAFPNINQPSLAIAGNGTGNYNRNITFNIGNYYGNESALKELTRKIIPIINMENNRKGI